MNTAASLLDALSVRIGKIVAWLGIPVMIVAAALEPVTRWIGWSSDAPLGEASTAAFFAMTMTAFGYAYSAGAHVRLDILSRRFAQTVNAAIELAGTLLVLLPLCALVVVDGVDSAWRSFLQGERWAGTGLPLQWAVRLWVPLGFALLMAAGLAAALRSVLHLMRK